MPTEGWLAIFYLFSTLATSPHFGHLSSRRSFSAPLEESLSATPTEGWLAIFYLFSTLATTPSLRASLLKKRLFGSL